MAKKFENQNCSIITTHGADGASSAAMLLQLYPKAEIIITSARRIAFTLDEINEGQDQPSTIHICGVGFSENVESIIETLKALKRKQFTIFWYCGRKYLDSYYPILKTVCAPIFIECESNTMAIYKHLRIPNNEKITLFLTLARTIC